MNNRIGLSLVSLHKPVEVKTFSEKYFNEAGKYPLYELSYRMDTPFIKNVDFIKGRVLSGHAPCPGEVYLPNFGSRDSVVVKESLDSIRQSMDTVRSFGGDVLVLHAGYTLDSPVFTEYAKRKKVLEDYEKRSTWLWLKDGSICKPGYESSEEYKVHMEETLKNLKSAADICMDKGIKLAVENLNPRLTYLFQIPDDFIRLIEEIPNIYICIDIGHLWISSLVHGHDYFEALRTLTSTDRVVSVHIHDNNSRGGKNPRYADDHGSFGTGTVPIEKSISVIVENSSANLIIEASSDPMMNLKKLDLMVPDPS